jgi:hypothetical protein
MTNYFWVSAPNITYILITMSVFGAMLSTLNLKASRGFKHSPSGAEPEDIWLVI